jgi:hypothetical protein
MAGLLDTIKDKAKQVYQQGLLNQVITNPASVGQEFSQLFDPSYMSQVKPMSQETAFDVALSAPMMGGITAYHGSPYSFNKFDPKKIGTGEGAQAYGHGLYFAENPAVAKEYQTELSKDVYGELIEKSGNKFNALDLPSGIKKVAANVWYENPNLKQAKKRLDEISPEYLGGSKKDVYKEIVNLSKSGVIPNKQASLYKVDIADETIPKMLDWDKPLTQQSKEVKNFVANMAKSTKTWNNYFPQLNPKAQKLANDMLSGEKPIVGTESAKYWKQLDKLNPNVDHNAIFDSFYNVGLRSGQRDITGSDLYNVLTKKSSQQQASNDLLKSGISGIKYLDQTSRVKNAGTSNYVVFDPETIKILERNGLLLP